MKLNNNEIYNFLTERGVEYLYHANSVATSITFIQNGGLLSRGAVEQNHSHQTPQDSDADDKKHNVWHDIFLDTKDLHSHFGRQNKYGPVLFKINIACLLDPSLDIWITKNNPIYWRSNESETNKYFQNINDIQSNWMNIESQKKMITLRNSQEPVLFNHLNAIIVDDCYLHELQLSTFNWIYSHITEACKSSNQQPLIPNIIKRACNNCYCQSNYSKEYDANLLNKFFGVLKKP